MSLESIIAHLAGQPATRTRARVLAIEPDGATAIHTVPTGRVNALYGARWARAALITPPPRGEIRITPGLLLAWSGGAPNHAASRLVFSELDAGARIGGEAVVFRYAPGGLLDLEDQEILWVQAMLDGHPPTGRPRG